MEQFEYDVFISYSRKDYVDENKNIIPGNVISKIKDLFKELNIKYWIDEEGIYSGDEFAGIIAKSIRKSRVFLYISSENSNASEWTSNEIASANAYKRKIIPFKLDQSLYNDTVMLYIAKLDFIDYQSNPEKGMKKLKTSICDYLKHLKIEEERTREENNKIEDEKRKSIEREKQIKELSEQIEKSLSKINDLKAQLQTETSLLNGYNQRMAELTDKPQPILPTEKEEKSEDKQQSQYDENQVHEGEILYGDGKYVGQIKGYLREGYGIYYWKNGDRYEGEWKHGIRTGHGTQYWSNGDRYEGEWKDGKRTGYGTQHWSNGDRFEGMWSDGVRVGNGTYYWPDGRRFEGVWTTDNRMIGKIYYPDGRVENHKQ